MSAGTSNRWVAALWKFIGVLIVFHLIVLLMAHFMSNKVGLYGLSVFWAHISGGLGTMSIALVVAIIIYYAVYKYWTEN